jgi:hypothetical protein
LQEFSLDGRHWGVETVLEQVRGYRHESC